MNIRFANISDIPSLLYIEECSFKHCDRFKDYQFRYLITKGKGLFFIGNCAFTGFDPLHVIYSSIAYVYLTNTGRIYSLASIEPGMGAYLLHFIENIDSDLKTYYLEVRRSNKKAISFYKKNGYKQYDIKYNYYPDGMDAILMKKDLQCKGIIG